MVIFAATLAFRRYESTPLPENDANERIDMRAFLTVCILAILALGASASPTPIRPDENVAANDAASSPRTHVYSRRPRAHP